MELSGYNFDDKKLSIYKAKAKKQYSLIVGFYKNKNRKKYDIPPEAGVYESDFSIHYKTNFIKNFDGFLIVIKKTKEHIYFN